MAGEDRGKGSGGKESREARDRARKAGTEQATEQVTEHPLLRGPAPAPGKGGPRSGKGRDARSVRERGANARRGNKPPPTEEKKEEKEHDEFWDDLVGEAYRSRKRRGDWKDTENLG